MKTLHWIIRSTLLGVLLCAWMLPVYAQPVPATSTSLTESFLRESSFVIPFQVDPAVTNPVEVQLYVSRDRGVTWQLADRQRPAAGRFSFRAMEDGTYWFSSRTISGQQPRDAKPNLQPELLIHVDTRQPQLDFLVKAEGPGRVSASWSAYDPLLDSNSFRIEYRSGPRDPWKAVDVGTSNDRALRAQLQGQTQWNPANINGLIDVRAEVRDRSGNLSAVSRRLRLVKPSQPVTQAQPGVVPRGVSPDPYLAQRPEVAPGNAWQPDNIPRQPQTPGRTSTAVASAGPNRSAENRSVSMRPATPQNSRHANPSHHPAVHNRQPGPQPADPGSQPAGNRVVAMPAAQELGPANERIEPPRGAEELPLPPRAASSDAHQMPSPANMRPVSPASDADSRIPDRMPLPRHHSAYLPPGERPTFSSGRSFELEYDVEAAGHQGVAEAQLWVTLDGGRRWVLWGKDDDRQSPIDITVREDGIFGFRMVIVGHNGLATPEPVAGEPADIWVGVDTVPPIVRLTGAQYGRGHQAGKLIIRWDARDTNLSPTPINLLFSDSPDGPWTLIAADLPDTGEYLWHPDATLPREIFVRIEARDQANNVGHAQLDRGIGIDGLAPRARIRGFKVKEGR